MYDSRLLGTWRSDARRTGREISARRDIKPAHGKRLQGLFGKLELRYTKTRCYVSFEGEVEAAAYRVIEKDRSSAAVVFTDSGTGEKILSHVHFEGRHYWICLGPIREYFRKIR